MNSPLVPLEVCINADNLSLMRQNVEVAVAAGASRIELCADMDNDGLTPPVEAVKIAKAACGEAELLVMIRPKAENFCYTPNEVQLMCRQIQDSQQAGADGIVLGPLTANMEIDLPTLNLLVNTAKHHHLSVTFHRAFDCINQWQAALQQLILAGVDRLLSSGTPWTGMLGAQRGLAKLSTLIKLGGGKVEIVIGGGVSPKNSVEIWRRLIVLEHQISLHTYSGVLEAEHVSADKVKRIVNIG